HQAVERKSRLLVGRHHGLALLERKRGRLAGGAEHVEAVAAGVEQEARELHRPRRVRRTGVIDRGRDGGDDAREFVVGHDGSSRRRRARSVYGKVRMREDVGTIRYSLLTIRSLYPLTLYAASAAMFTTSVSFDDKFTICTELSSPTSNGPMTVAPPSVCSILVEIAAEWNAGITSTLAGPERRQSG